MNATAEAVPSAVGARTLEILERRRTTSFKRRGRLVRAALLLADLVGLTLAFAITELAFGARPERHGQLTRRSLALRRDASRSGSSPPKLYGLYDRDEERADHSTVDDFVGVFHLVTVGVWLLVAALGSPACARPARSGSSSPSGRSRSPRSPPRGRSRAARCRRQLAYLQNTVIVGAGDVGQLVARKLLQHPEYGIDLVGFVDASPRNARADLAARAGARRPDELPALVDAARRRSRHLRVLARRPRAGRSTLIRSLREPTSRSTSCRGCSRSSARSRASTRVEGVPLVGLPPAKALALVARASSAHSTSSARVARPRPDRARSSPSSPGGSSATRQGPCFFRQTRLGLDMQRVHGPQVPDDARRTPTTRAHREYIEQTMSVRRDAGRRAASTSSSGRTP